MANKKYGVASLQREFPNDDVCLQFIFDVRHSRECRLQMPPQTAARCGGIYAKIAGRRQFQCSKCRFQLAPAAGTIFHKSDTPLVLWFHAILAFFNARGEISAKQLERDMEVTYKCAWRILGIIREALIHFTRLKSGNLTYSEVLTMAIQTKYRGQIRFKKKRTRWSRRILG